jgi:hypothetical protein
MIYRSFSPLIFAVASSTCLPAPAALAIDHGSFSRRPGESRQFTIGSAYFSLRVCNDIASAGIIGVRLGARDERRLAPGLCIEQSGDRLDIRNLADGISTGVFVSACEVRH